MAWGDTEDYWFSRPQQQESMLPAMQFGAQLRQQAIRNALDQKNAQLEAQRTGIQIQEYFSKQELRNKIMAGNANLAKSMAKFTDMTDSRIPETIYGVLAENPEMFEIAEKFLDNHRLAVQFKQKKDELELTRLQQLQGKKTAPMMNLEEADRMEAEAEAMGIDDPAKAESLRRNATLLRSTVTAPSEVIETYTDSEGKQQFRIAKGAAAEKSPKDSAAPTTSTVSQVQQRLISAEKGIELGNSLMSVLTDADIGVRGNVNQIVINEGLAQLIPGLQKGQVTEARTMLGQFKENALKAIASDPRISDKDRAALEKILPSLGAVESVQSAKDKIKVFVDRFREQSRTDAIAAKIPIPNWALTITEIRDKVKNGELTEDEAVQIMVKFH